MWSEWTTAQIALVVSGFSFALSLASFLWNVWSKFIFPKPRVQVTAALAMVDNSFGGIFSFHRPSLPSQKEGVRQMEYPAVKIEAVNLGPGTVHLDTAFVASGGKLHSRKHGYHPVSGYSNYPYDLDGTFTTKNMKKPVAPAETVQYFFPITDELIEKYGPHRVGFRDTFSRLHFCSRKDAKHLRKSILELKEVGSI